jgi:hypothetical protein
MIGLKDAIIDALNNLTSEGLRLKKFRQPILDSFADDTNIANVKTEFEHILNELCNEKVAVVDNGIVKSLQSSKKRPRDTSSVEKTSQSSIQECATNDNSSEMEIAILANLQSLPIGGQRLKKFRQAILDHFDNGSNVDELKTEFGTIFDRLCDEKVAQFTDGIVTCLQKNNGNNNKNNAKKPAYKKIEHVDTDLTISTKELYKDGEKAWRNGLLDEEYLSKNPDRITRLFCGNLKLTITEEQLTNCINGITHIKWMTDKQTREFYGSTFIEMKDPAAAAAAVQLDKTKLLGRYVMI